MPPFRGLSSSKTRSRLDFESLAHTVLSFSPSIRWIALEEAGRRPRWAWRDRRAGLLFAEVSKWSAELVDPLLLLIAEGWGQGPGGAVGAVEQKLRFVVLVYEGRVQVVIPYRAEAHLTVAVEPDSDVYELGSWLVSHLTRWMRQSGAA